MTVRIRKKLKGTNRRPYTVYLPEDLDQLMRNEAHRNGRTLSEETARTLRAGRRVMHADHENKVA